MTKCYKTLNKLRTNTDMQCLFAMDFVIMFIFQKVMILKCRFKCVIFFLHKECIFERMRKLTQLLEVRKYFHAVGMSVQVCLQLAEAFSSAPPLLVSCEVPVPLDV